jgi:hypothetical protein
MAVYETSSGSCPGACFSSVLTALDLWLLLPENQFKTCHNFSHFRTLVEGVHCDNEK